MCFCAYVCIAYLCVDIMNCVGVSRKEKKKKSPGKIKKEKNALRHCWKSVPPVRDNYCNINYIDNRRKSFKVCSIIKFCFYIAVYICIVMSAATQWLLLCQKQITRSAKCASNVPVEFKCIQTSPFTRHLLTSEDLTVLKSVFLCKPEGQCATPAPSKY